MRVEMTAMQCFIYKSQRKADTYVFLCERDGFSALPPPIAERLGTLAFVMELELSAERKLAREPAATVMDNLTRRGFHLQMPPIDPEAPSESA